MTDQSKGNHNITYKSVGHALNKAYRKHHHHVAEYYFLKYLKNSHDTLGVINK